MSRFERASGRSALDDKIFWAGEIWAEQGATSGGMPPAEMAALVKSEIAKWAKVVKDSGAKVDN